MRRVLFSLFITLTAFAISANAVAPLISTISAETGIEASSFGLFIFIQFISFALISFAGGFLKARFHLTNYLLVSAGLLVITLAFFLGPFVLASSAVFIVWVIPLGLSGGAVETFSSIEIPNISSKTSSKTLSLSQVFYSIGGFLAPQLVYLCLSIGLSWKMIFILFGIFSFMVTLFFMGVNQQRMRKDKQPAGGPVQTDKVRKKHSFPRGVFALLLFLMLCYVILESFSAAWLSFIFETEYRITARDASIALILFWLGMVAGRLLIVFLPDRYTLWAALLGSSLLILLSSLLLVLTEQMNTRLILVFLLGAAFGPMWPVMVMISSLIFPSDAFTAGIIGMGAVGFATGPLFGGLLVRNGLGGQYFTAALLLSIMIFLLCGGSYVRYRYFLLKQSRSRSQQQ